MAHYEKKYGADSYPGLSSYVEAGVASSLVVCGKSGTWNPHGL